MSNINPHFTPDKSYCQSMTMFTYLILLVSAETIEDKEKLIIKRIIRMIFLRSYCP